MTCINEDKQEKPNTEVVLELAPPSHLSFRDPFVTGPTRPRERTNDLEIITNVAAGSSIDVKPSRISDSSSSAREDLTFV